MRDTPSLDELFLSDRNSVFIFRLSGKRSRIGMRPNDLMIVNRALPYTAGKPALVVVKGQFQVQVLSPEFIQQHEPESGDFIWGMVQTIVRELA
jgi:hypothetical protein